MAHRVMSDLFVHTVCLAECSCCCCIGKLGVIRSFSQMSSSLLLLSSNLENMY